MAGKPRRRRDQIWNPPSQGVDISALFVVMAAGPLLLPLIGAQLDVMAFFTPFVFCTFAVWRCTLAARRGRKRRRVWLVLATAVAIAAVASLIAVAAPEANGAFYVGFAASIALLAAALLLAGRNLRGANFEQLADALLVPVVAVAVCAWFVLIPGFANGDAILTAVVLVDLVAFCAATMALVARPTHDNARVVGPFIAALALVIVGDALISAEGAGDLATNGIPTALLWAAAAYGIAVAADFDHLEGARHGDAIELSGSRWLLVRVLAPLATVLAFPLVGVGLWAAGELTVQAALWFGPFCLSALVLAFGRQAYLLVDNRRSVLRERTLREEVMRRNEELEALTALATTMTETLEEAPIIERGLGVLHLAARASSSALHVLAGEKLKLEAATGDWQTERTWAGSPLVPEGPNVTTRGGRHILRLVLATRGQTIGTITIIRPLAQPFDEQQLKLLGLLSDQLAIAVQNARDFCEKLEQAIRDPLTGIYNRRFFYEALEKEVQRSARYGNTSSVVVLDIDDFKTVNDTRGHQAGDEVLRRIAAIVSDLIRPADSFARLGGEEFALLLPETSQFDALLTAERLRIAIGRTEVLPGRRVSVSGGVAACPQDATSVEELEKKADGALYWAKRNGKNLCVLASEVMLVDEEADQETSLAHLHALVSMIDAQHLNTRDHSENVAAYTVALGRELGLDPDHIVRLRTAAHFHDIGKVAVATAILNKPSGLTEKEMSEMRLHPTVGATMLLHAGLAEESEWVRLHHERIDGGGYPDGLDAPQIPLEARVILVADAFEAMTSDRPYRDGLPADVAIAELRRCAGTQFDPEIVEALARLVESSELTVLALRNHR